MSRYPTKEEILEEWTGEGLLPFLILKDWKRKFWKGWGKKTEAGKNVALDVLLDDLCNIRTGRPNWDFRNGPPCFDPVSSTIHLDINNPSVLSTLHEFGHWLYGPSELKSCRFSVHLFKDVFPKDYARLRWEGHMLKV